MRDVIGRTLGPYRVVEQLGAGGMAIVYKAYQPAMDRFVALKVPSTALLEDAHFRARFRQEARTIAQLEHPHILPVHDFGEDQDIPYLVMRYVDGGTLRELASRGLLALDQSLRLIADVADALAYAHAKGVIHRDVKPANILLDRDGTALLTDFGIAKLVEQTMALTGSAALGTPAYMAPEQVSGEPVDVRTDIYALGVMLYELLTGRRPFEGDTPLAVAMKHVTEPLPPPRQVRPTVPDAAERIILKAMAKDPADRYQTASDLARDLRRLLSTLDKAADSEPAASTQFANGSTVERVASQDPTALSDGSGNRPGSSPPSEPAALMAGRAREVSSVDSGESTRRTTKGAERAKRGIPFWAGVAGALLVLVVAGGGILIRISSGAPPAVTPTFTGTPSPGPTNPPTSGLTGQGVMAVASTPSATVTMQPTLMATATSTVTAEPTFTATAPPVPSVLANVGSANCGITPHVAGLGADNGQFNAPEGVAVDRAGHVYVIDTGNHRVQECTSSGAFLTRWGGYGSGNGQLGEPNFQGPRGAAVDSAGNVYVADRDNDRIQKFTSSGTYLTRWGSHGAGKGQFAYPLGVAVDSAGNVYVADSGNALIQKFTSSGTYLTQWRSLGTDKLQIGDPEGVAVDNAGNVYVADWFQDLILKFTSSGTMLTQWGSPGMGNGQFNHPIGVAVDSAGNVYVADSSNNRIEKFTSSGTFLTQWGGLGSGDGQFSTPMGVAVDSTGTVYVADRANNRIQKFTSSGALLTR